ncbi:5'-3' exonuclease [Jatrophihabitans telluris]|uniref:5'-3' exonuclease n=1 Tax=Jatrophihabitans telluris TaxID=2038343 RepID=A0ABY4QZP7_9ACTN|nr:5'-3' exonuclease [Jatrophihabitans telluris]UQX88798.1 5'-3' exonuclease [Jatrophihabitans telluris]
MSAEPSIILAVDGNSIVHRSFHALAATGLRSPDGRPMWAVRGLLSQLVTAAERVGPAAIVVGFDDPDSSRRRDRWPQYKAHRVDKLDSLVEQLRLAIEVLSELGLCVVVPDGLEADDVLASTAALARGLGARTVVMTSDRDSFALIDDNTSVLRIINGGVEASPMLTPERLVTLTGVRPDQYRDFAALRGDPSDNLPGVRGIGPKTAAKLLAALGSAHEAFEDLAAGGDRVRSAVGAGLTARLSEPASRQAWELNCQVMSFSADVAVPLTLESGPGVLPVPADTVRDVFARQQLPSTLPYALRALAHVEQAGPAPVVASERVWPDDRRTYWRGQRYGRLPAKPEPPKAEQLSLFG